MLTGRRLTSFMSLFVVAIAVAELWVNVSHPYAYTPYNTLDRFGYSIMFVVGLVNYLARDSYNVVQKIGSTGLTLGFVLFLDRSISVWVAFHNKDDHTAIELLYEYLQLILSLLIIYFSVRYYRGSIRDSIRLAASMTLSASMIVYLLLFALINQQKSWAEFSAQYLPDTIATLMFFVFILCIFTPGAYETGSLSRLRKTLDGLVAHTTTPRDSKILRSDLLALESALKDTGSWEDSVNGLPFREYRVRVGAVKDYAKLLIFRCDPNGGSIRVMVANLTTPENVQSTSFDFLGLVPVEGDSLSDCGLVRIYGTHGFFADILVEDSMEGYEPDIVDKFLEFDKKKNQKVAEWRKKIWQ